MTMLIEAPKVDNLSSNFVFQFEVLRKRVKKLIKIRNNRGIWRVELQILALNGLDQLISLLDNW